jgi:hypothetical protein
VFDGTAKYGPFSIHYIFALRVRLISQQTHRTQKLIPAPTGMIVNKVSGVFPNKSNVVQ